MKLLIQLLYLFLGLILSFVLYNSIYYQIEVEQYITEQKEECGMLEGIEREHYEPIAIFAVRTLISKETRAKRPYTKYLYSGKNCSHSHGFYDLYTVYCYPKSIEGYL